jgi:hypothetical protein
MLSGDVTTEARARGQLQPDSRIEAGLSRSGHPPGHPSIILSLAAFALLLAVLFGCSVAGAREDVAGAAFGDQQWWDGFGGPSIVGIVNAITVYEGDLIVGGEFTEIGGCSCRSIARWDGSSWQPMGTPSLGPVEALAVYDGELIAGGRGDNTCAAGSPGRASVNRWNGISWAPLGDGISPSDPAGYWDHRYYEVHALAVCDGQLFAGGWFVTSAGSYLLRWNGFSWNSVGADTLNGTVLSMTTCGSSLVVGGEFKYAGSLELNCIGLWDGSQWAALGTGVTHDDWNQHTTDVLGLAAYDGDLIAGGNFSIAGGVDCNRIARWDGEAWSSMGFVGGPPPHTGYHEIRAVSAYGDSLVVGGTFKKSNAAVGDYIAIWDGAAWSELGGGTNYPVDAILADGGDLFVGGEFRNAGPIAASGIASWDGTTWSSYGPPGEGIAGIGAEVVTWETGRIADFLTYDGRLVAVGAFVGAGNTSARNVAAWNGTSWEALGNGLSNAEALTTYRDTLVAGCSAWDGTSWHAFGSPSGSVLDLIVYDDDLIACGSLQFMNGKAAKNIVAWDGSSWSVIGGGTNMSVGALTIGDGNLIAGGNFTAAGGEVIAGVASWDKAAWSQIGEGLDTYTYGPGIRSFAWYDDELIAGGQIERSDTVDISGVAAWDGAAWRALGGGTEGEVYALTEYKGTLVAGGDFTEIGGIAANNIARWNGACWAPFGSGTDDGVRALAVYDGYLYAGGLMMSAGGKPSHRIARWKDDFPGVVMRFSAERLDSAIELTWTNPATQRFDGMVVRYSTSDYPGNPESGSPVPNGDQGRFGGEPGAAGSFSHTGLPNGITHYYAAFAYDDASAYSCPSLAAAMPGDSTRPAPPVEFTAVQRGDTVRISWTNPPDPDLKGVRIRFSKYGYPSSPKSDPLDGYNLPNGNGGRFEGPPGVDSSFSHAGLERCNTYYYSAWSYDDGLNYSKVARASVSLGIDALSDFVVLPGDGQVYLTWTHPAAPESNAVFIRVSTDSFPAAVDEGDSLPNGDGGRFVGLAGDVNYFFHSGLNNGETYYYGAFTGRPGGRCIGSPVRLAVTPHEGADLPPHPVPCLGATADDGVMYLAWQNPDDPDVAGTMIRYSVLRYPSSPTEGDPVKLKNNGCFPGIPGQISAFTRSGILPGTTYYYSAFAYDEAYNYALPARAAGRYESGSDCVTGFQALPGDGQIELRWTNPVDTAFTATHIRFSTAGNPGLPDGTAVPGGADGTFYDEPGSAGSFVHTGLANGTRVYYAAFAYYATPGEYSVGVGAAATPVDTASMPPAAVDAFEAGALEGAIEITWTNSPDARAKGTLVRYSLDAYPSGPTEGLPVPNGTEGRFDGEAGADSSFAHAGVKQGIPYLYGAFAYDETYQCSSPKNAEAIVGIDTLPSFGLQPAEGAIHLEWVNPGQSDFDAAVIRYSTGEFPKTVADGLPVPNGNGGVFLGEAGTSLGFDHTGLASDSAYKYSAFVRLGDPERYSSRVCRVASPEVAPDRVPPDLAIAVFQNPYLSQYLDVWVIGSEPLDSASVRLAVGDTRLRVLCNDPDRNVWKGDYTLKDSVAIASIVAEACDVHGNQGRDSTQFAAAFVRVSWGGAVVSPDGSFAVRIGPGAVRQDQYVTLVPAAQSGTLGGAAAGVGFFLPEPSSLTGPERRGYLIGPSGAELETPCCLEWSYSEDDLPAGMGLDQLYFEQQGVGPLESFVDPEAGRITAATLRFGLVWLASGPLGSSRIADPDFLEMDPSGPNPSAQSTAFRCEIRSEQMLRIDVYDVMGRHIATLVDRVALPGGQHITWTGRTADGDPVADGVYVIRAQTEHRTAALKVVRMR